MKPHLRNGTYHLVKKVPVRYRRVETRQQVWISLKTDSLAEAQRRAPATWADMLTSWEAMLKGDSAEAIKRYESARETAQALGYRYSPAKMVADLPIDEVVDRLNSTFTRTGKPQPSVAAALLGGVDRPAITISKALEIYWSVTQDRLTGKSDNQIRKWRNPRIKAVRNFIDVVGDTPMHQLTPDDMLDFRDWWSERVKEEGLNKDSANKDFSHLSDVLRTVSGMKRLHLDLPFRDMRLRGAVKNKRPAFSSAWIKEKILAPDALNGLNPEARAILLGMINTGYRPSEAACLGPDQIFLDHKTPHISIEPVGRTLKSHNAMRRIPLIGVSLEAFREHPYGFARYQDTESLTDTVNKFMTENGLRETPKHTFYSLRHSFQDRMVNAQIDDRIRRDLFGHAKTEEVYGDGASLELAHKLLLPISF